MTEPLDLIREEIGVVLVHIAELAEALTDGLDRATTVLQEERFVNPVFIRVSEILHQAIQTSNEHVEEVINRMSDLSEMVDDA